LYGFGTNDRFEDFRFVDINVVYVYIHMHVKIALQLYQ